MNQSEVRQSDSVLELVPGHAGLPGIPGGPGPAIPAVGSRGIWIGKSDLQFSFSRSSGPGGQAVNKLNTRAQLRVSIGDIRGLSNEAAARLRRLAGRRLTLEDQIVIESDTHRSQLDNKEACIERLRSLVAAAAIAPKIRRKKRPTRSMIEKRLAGKRKTAEKKSLRRSKSWRAED
ncbi:MAG: aminoacyl-tRNA hydrolase [Phycisphaerales bacterium]|nr:aminoacyl-tRNA hydrolase [Phycisphaerales bacterium]MCI0629874.1 aminoacyl-tRNA hydrolase [Phycisphaerales bacterium]MCI0675047.1 aminoacyl-tRNA hydrolase [Phycisphaerales bacterium]